MRAARGPLFLWLSILETAQLDSSACAATECVSSVDPSLITITSMSRYVWFAIDSIAEEIVSAELYAGMTIENFRIIHLF